jgi:hypothetical protein
MEKLDRHDSTLLIDRKYNSRDISNRLGNPVCVRLCYRGHNANSQNRRLFAVAETGADPLRDFLDTTEHARCAKFGRTARQDFHFVVCGLPSKIIARSAQAPEDRFSSYQEPAVDPRIVDIFTILVVTRVQADGQGRTHPLQSNEKCSRSGPVVIVSGKTGRTEVADELLFELLSKGFRHRFSDKSCIDAPSEWMELGAAWTTAWHR